MRTAATADEDTDAERSIGRTQLLFSEHGKDDDKRRHAGGFAIICSVFRAVGCDQPVSCLGPRVSFGSAAIGNRRIACSARLLNYLEG